jgi:hypothetical protein
MQSGKENRRGEPSAEETMQLMEQPPAIVRATQTACRPRCRMESFYGLDDRVYPLSLAFAVDAVTRYPPVSKPG